MASLLTFLAWIFGVLPIISLPIIWVLSVGMSNIYLKACLSEEQFNTEAMFSGFTSKNFARYAGGIGWQKLWILIWGLIPLIGFVFAIIKFFSYMFVPYILIDNPEISPTEALRLSMKQTKGYKGKLFLAYILPLLAYGIALFILAALALIPYIGILFGLLYSLLALAISVFSPIFYGLLTTLLFLNRKVEYDKQ